MTNAKSSRRRKQSDLQGPLSLFKPGIVFLVLVCTLFGYGLGFQVEQNFSIEHLLLLLFGVGLLSGGSLALNQAQEWKIDKQMDRTKGRPIASGRMDVFTGFLLGGSFVVLGSISLFFVKPIVFWLGLLTVLLYNVLYTMIWKPKWAFAAVPGAIPGAMPVVLGYAAINPYVWTSECLYLFLIMYLWQMPHFWALAIRFRDDYVKAGFPVISGRISLERMLFHIGLYTTVYLFVAISSPWFVEIWYTYLFLVVPFVFKVAWEFGKFYKTCDSNRWLPFFMWVNFSLLAFLITPVVDKWGLFISIL